MLRLLRTTLFAVLLLMVAPQSNQVPVHADGNVEVNAALLQPPSACPTIVKEALDSIGTTCATMLPNSACYGFNRVSALFSEAVDTDNIAFSVPSDRVDIALLNAIETSPLDEGDQIWGLALLNVRANIPNTLPGQNVLFLLMGDARIENEVAPEELIALAPAVTVTTSANARIRSQPDLRANIVTIVPETTTLTADIANQDGTWLRVTLPDPLDPANSTIAAWISREVLRPDAAIDTLSRPELTRMSPMQAFSFSTGIGQTTCAEAQGALLIQGPNNVVIDLQVNGAQIRVSSTVLLTSSTENNLKVTTLSGEVSANGLVIPAGYTSEASSDGEGQIDGGFAVPHRIQPEELLYAQRFNELDPSLLNYALDVPESVEQIEPADFEDFKDYDFDDYYEDFDADGVSDDADNCWFISNPDQTDDDRDGIGDVCLNQDSDGDGVDDSKDNCRTFYNPEQTDRDGDGIGDDCATLDFDGDGIPDAVDICIDVFDPDQTDSDGDGIGEVCDPFPDDPRNGQGEETNPGGEGDKNPDIEVKPGQDSDGDGIEDAVDNCRAVYNPDQRDSDGDGFGDDCDDPSNEPIVDTDGDGVPDGADNCKEVYNPDQRDSDGDGFGDACDEPSNEPPPDSDGDGVPDEADNCKTVYNPDQRDSDSDGIGDACDEPSNEPPPDSDGDGVPDEADNCKTAYNPDQRDSDSDGIGDACDSD